MRLDAILCCEVDDCLLESFNVTSDAQTYCVKVDNGITYKLSGTMEGDIATTVNVEELGTEALEILRRTEHILGMATLTKGIHSRMLNDKDCSARIALLELLVELLGTQSIEERTLQIPALAIRHCL
jgi:hypothetical protein